MPFMASEKRLLGQFAAPDALNDPFLFFGGRHPFEPNRKDYSPNNAWWLAEISAALYLSEAGIRSLSSQDKLPFEGGGIRFFSYAPPAGPEVGGIGVQSALFRGSQYAIAGFRGSDTSFGWLTNIATALLPTPHGQIHSGFWNALHGPGSLWPQMRGALAFHGKPVWFTGHSQGAALALAAALDAQVNGVPVAGAYLYGCPRVGDGSFVAALPAPVFRIVNETDAVTQVPVPLPVVLPYHHAGQEVWLDAEGQLRNEAAPPPDLAAVEELLALARNPQPGAALQTVLKMHAIRAYADKLWNLLP
jgi:triacylglycerol lipase